MDEFLRELQETIHGNVSLQVEQDTLNYYRNYFREQKAAGKSEQQIVKELGNGRIIGRSVMDANPGGAKETMGSQSRYTETSSADKPSVWEQIKVFAVIAAVLIVVLFVVGLVFRVVWAVLPLVLVIMLIVWLVKKI